MRWLQYKVLDEHIRLTPQQRKAVHNRVQVLFGMEWWSQFVRMGPGLVPLAMLPLLQKAAKNWSTWGQLWLSLGCVSLSLGAMIWMFRTMYRRHANRAVRELGLADICARCGYDLSGMPQGAKRCPECGTDNVAMPRRPAADALPP